jgi:hypothetical protein
MSNSRFRVTVNGFYVRAQTWDDVFNWDGFGDEIYFVGAVKSINSDKTEHYSSDVTSFVLGDTSADAPLIRAGNAKSTGGLQTGDTFPTSEPWKKGRTDNLRQNYPPFLIWEGELPPNGRAAFISVAVYEWDPGESPLKSLLKWLDEASTKFKDRIQTFLGPTGKKIYDGVELGLDILGSLDDSGALGQSGSKPIGLVRTGASTAAFTPKVLVLNYDNAMQIVNDRPAGKDYGVLEFNYVNDPYYRGDYAIYLQVEQVLEEGSVVKSPDDSRIYTIVGGGKLWIESLNELERRYGGLGSVVEVAYGTIQNLPDYPQDDTVIKEWDRPEVYVVLSGARVWIPNPDELNRYYGGWQRVIQIPTGTAARLSDRPRPGTIFKERTTGRIALFAGNGQKIPWFPMPFYFPKIYIVPDGTLDRLP